MVCIHLGHPASEKMDFNSKVRSGKDHLRFLPRLQLHALQELRDAQDPREDIHCSLIGLSWCSGRLVRTVFEFPRETPPLNICAPIIFLYSF
jgi:hypothetical protein